MLTVKPIKQLITANALRLNVVLCGQSGTNEAKMSEAINKKLVLGNFLSSLDKAQDIIKRPIIAPSATVKITLTFSCLSA